MMPVELVDGFGDHDAVVRAVVERLMAGQVVVIPTETVYGVAA